MTTFWTRIALGLLCALLVLCVPWTYYTFDVTGPGGWLTWARASGGDAPWEIYRRASSCNYPPLTLYLLTLIERARLAWHWPMVSPGVITLVKLPNLAAIVAGVPLCRFGLRRVWGDDSAKQGAWAWALCLPLWFNAAVWGQYDALLTLLLVAAVVALLNDSFLWCGIAVGAALAMKAQAIVLVPALAVYLLRRHGIRGVAAALAACVLTWGVITLPFWVHGAGGGVLRAYTGSVGQYSVLEMGAMNGWYLLDRAEVHIFHRPGGFSIPDTQQVLHLISYKAIGMAALSVCVLFLLAALWRRPARTSLVVICAMSMFTFFMLPTEMHDRYLVPAVPLLALIAAGTPAARRLFTILSVTALLNQALVMHYPHTPVLNAVMQGQDWLTHNASLDQVIAVVNLGTFAAAMVWVWRNRKSSS